MMSEQHLTNTPSEANPGFNFGRFEKGTRYYTINMLKETLLKFILS